MASSDSLSHFDKESSQESCAQLLAWFSTSCCQHQFWRLPCLQKKFDAQKLREQKCLPLCLVVIRRFLSNILWEEKSCLWKLHGGATRKSTFCEFFFSQSKFFANTFRNMPFDLEHSINVMRLSYTRNGLKCKMNIFSGERGGGSWLFLKHFSVLIICRRS